MLDLAIVNHGNEDTSYLCNLLLQWVNAQSWGMT
jgi:hypothetical protein